MAPEYEESILKSYTNDIFLNIFQPNIWRGTEAQTNKHLLRCRNGTQVKYRVQMSKTAH